MRRLGLSITILAGLLAAAALPAHARGKQCLPTVDQELAKLGIPSDDIERISVLPRRQAGNLSDRIIGYDAAVRFKSCTGYLAIDMNRVCRVQQVYSRNECRFPGVPNY